MKLRMTYIKTVLINYIKGTVDYLNMNYEVPAKLCNVYIRINA